MNIFKKEFITSIVIILLLLVSGWVFWSKWNDFLKTNIIKKGDSVHVFISSGDTIRTIAADLVKNANLANPTYLIWYVKIKGVSKDLKAGEYNFEGPMTPYQLVQQMKEGKVVQHSITFVEGLTIANILQELKNNPNIKHDTLSLSNKELLLKLKIKHNNLEGLFFPDTYRYIYGTSDLTLLKISHQKMLKVLGLEWKNREKNLPYKTPYQALIVASMIEKESALQNEQELIAGVIINRLKKNMYLQIDPTVIYGIKDNFNGKITLTDLRSNNVYNTYRHKGLPPSPICLPGQSAIYAALHPSRTDYLYFVATGNGSHIFSKTLKQHDKNIREYILKETETETKTEKSSINANK